VNCGFETGSLTGWTVLGDTNGAGVDTVDAFNGTYGAYLAGFATTTDLRQTIPTVVGQQYVLSYFTAYDAAAIIPHPSNSFVAQIQGVSVPGSLQQNVGEKPWGFNGGFFFTATSTATRLDFIAQDRDFFFSLDDVSVMATPEPASFFLLLPAFGYLALRRRSKLAQA
jgi:hypothetical protein